MTRVTYAHDASAFSLTSKGHADYAPAGQDIVCAGISALCGALELALDNLQDAGRVRTHFCSLSDAFFHAEAEAANGKEEVRTVFETVYNGLCRIAEAYPDHLQCKKTILKKEDKE